MEQIIQRLKNIFADPTLQTYKNVEKVWKDLGGIDNSKLSYSGYFDLEKFFIDISPEILIWKYDWRFVLGLRESKGWIVKIEILKSSQTPPTLPIAFDLECD